jgi:hypothetical protein
VRTGAPAAAALDVVHLAAFGAVVAVHGAATVVLRTVPHGTSRALGHCHQDLASVYVASGGRWVQSDPGVSTYTGDLRSRAALRAAGAHPTLVPDDRQWLRPTGPFSGEARPVTERVTRTPRGIRVEHAFQGDRYFLSLRLARDGQLVVRQWTRAARRNDFTLAGSGTSYGYRV